jgi:hypothetical protein
MASSDYDRPTENPVDHTSSTYRDKPATWTGPLGTVMAIIFILLLAMAILG